jgi:hypothetical protein
MTTIEANEYYKTRTELSKKTEVLRKLKEDICNQIEFLINYEKKSKVPEVQSEITGKKILEAIANL